ncbi:hypothetical protein DPMN_143834 [Dreissena polymorpha]|uniref:Uncharacterized protein n=1 Tax=Dreissena polymorpha TaxID=45954 RepID=A0A9D4GJW5_DREPO|nr:hypothetical protein DPMN_143834 [Dreissena polymorpha]
MGKYDLERSATKQWELRWTGRNELRLNIAPTASCIAIHIMIPKKRTCKRQQQRVTEIMESAVSGEDSTSSSQNQEPGRLKASFLCTTSFFFSDLRKYVIIDVQI